MQSIKIPSTKGEIAGVFHKASSKQEKLAILCPGYLDSKDYTHLVVLAEELSQKGYDVVRFDPTGTWESGDNIEDYTISQQLSDFRSIIDFLAKDKEYREVLVGGHSRGGMVAMLYAEQDSRVTGIVAIMSPYSISTTINPEKLEKWKIDGYRASLRDIPNSQENKEFRVPYSSYKADGEQYNVLNMIGKVYASLILVAGEKDNVIPVEDVKKVFEQANEPKRLIVMNGIGHDYRNYIDQVKEVTATLLKELETIEKKS